MTSHVHISAPNWLENEGSTGTRHETELPSGDEEHELQLARTAAQRLACSAPAGRIARLSLAEGRGGKQSAASAFEVPRRWAGASWRPSRRKAARIPNNRLQSPRLPSYFRMDQQSRRTRRLGAEARLRPTENPGLPSPEAECTPAPMQ